MLLLFSACYDDTDLKDSIEKLDSRVDVLEKLCATMNANAASLQVIIDGLQNWDYVTNVVPIKENDVEVGYTLTFANAGVVTIRHGKDGANGTTPQISVKTAADGHYYWTLNGEFLKNTNGENIKVSANNGKDGITPRMKIENGFWFVSTDNGASWLNLGKATGVDGKDGKAFFQNVVQTDENVLLTLSNGTVITLPKHQLLAIEFNNSNEIAITPGGSVTIDYIVKGTTNPDKLMIKALGQNGWSARVMPDEAEKLKGKLVVTAPEPFTNEDVLVWVHDGDVRTIVASLNFVTGVITPAEIAYRAGIAKGSLEVKVETNLQYTVEIPPRAQNWLSVASTRTTMRAETLTFMLAANTGAQRTAIVGLKSSDGRLIKNIAITQEAAENQEYTISFTTLKTEGQSIRLVINALPEDRGGVWIDLNNNGIEDADEAVTSFDNYADYIITAQTITIHGKVTVLNCANNIITSLDVSNNTALKKMWCYENQLTELDVSRNTALTYLSCNLNQLAALDVSNNIAIDSLYCRNNQLVNIDVTKNTALKDFWCADNRLTALDVSKNPDLMTLVCRNNQLTALNLDNNTALTRLDCNNNLLTTLNLNNNTELSMLYCFNNQLTALNVSDKPNLTYIGCGDNQISALSVANNPLLTSIYCYGNNLNGDAITALVASLHSRTSMASGTLYALADSYENNSTPTSSDIASANAKNWQVMRWLNSSWQLMHP